MSFGNILLLWTGSGIENRGLEKDSKKKRNIRTYMKKNTGKTTPFVKRKKMRTRVSRSMRTWGRVFASRDLKAFSRCTRLDSARAARVPKTKGDARKEKKRGRESKREREGEFTTGIKLCRACSRLFPPFRLDFGCDAPMVTQ